MNKSVVFYNNSSNVCADNLILLRVRVESKETRKIKLQEHFPSSSDSTEAVVVYNIISSLARTKLSPTFEK